MSSQAIGEQQLVSERRRLRAGYLGRVDYAAATRLQCEIRDRVVARSGDEHLLLLEHPHVYTLGRNASAGDVVADPAWLDERGVTLHETDRGGQVTYHGPGQLVGYPIIDLKPERRDVRRYVRDLEEVLVHTLADWEIEAEAGLRDRPIGVWAGGRKIASVGVHLRHWVTSHGFALNVTSDLSFFSGIVACGMPNAPMTSMEALAAQRPALTEVADRVVIHFCDVFDRDPFPLGADGAQAAPVDCTGSARR